MNNYNMKDIIEKELKKISKDLFVVQCKGDIIKFEERVKIKCFQCQQYNMKWTCPPKIPNIDYGKMFSEYENKFLVYCKMDFKDKDEFQVIRRESTNCLHRSLLKLEEKLYYENYPLAVAFIGGSCKLCREGCNKEKCRFPQHARIPLEALGINVVKLFQESTGITIKFPLENVLFRIGMILC